MSGTARGTAGEPAANFVVRQYADESDYDAVIDLWEHSGPGVRLSRSDSRLELKKKVEFEPTLFLVAERSGVLMGTVIGGFDGRRGMIYHLAVADAERARGIGSALMAAIESRLRQMGCIRAYLMVTKDNPAALEFYGARGWSVMDVHLMGKDLE